MKKLYLILGVLLLVNFVLANGEHNFDEIKKLIDSKISCDKLTNEQLEEIGEYYMEQMHPGEAHEIMDNMMGGEGSESLKQMHINMARTMYCGESSGVMGSGGMMGMMSMMNMMGGGMMNPGNNMMGQGMVGNYGYRPSYLSFLNVLYIILLIGLIVLIYLWIVKLWKDISQRK